MTRGEVKLWDRLKNKQMMGMDFDRQRPILHYIVDFYCKDLMLAIEVDGSSHNSREEEDKIRQHNLEEKGVKFLRFTEFQAVKHTDEVMNIIARFIEGENLDAHC